MLPIRVYHEDTDCGGVVYYANYHRYFERGGTEFLRKRGVSLTDCHEKGFLFVVTSAEPEYLSPARYDDLLLLDTQLTDISRITMTFRHIITREGSAKELVLASVNTEGGPVGLPDDVRRIVGAC